MLALWALLRPSSSDQKHTVKMCRVRSRRVHNPRRGSDANMKTGINILHQTGMLDYSPYVGLFTQCGSIHPMLVYSLNVCSPNVGLFTLYVGLFTVCWSIHPFGTQVQLEYKTAMSKNVLGAF